jgi:hypothetical protein
MHKSSRASKVVPVVPATVVHDGNLPVAVAATVATSGARGLAPGSRVAVRNYARSAPWLDGRDIEQQAALVALVVEAEDLDETARGDGGFGSTGK